MPGVVAGLTGEDAARLSDAMPPAMDLPAKGARGPLQSRCLALGHATYFGQPVAALVATSVQDAQAALEKIRVEYEVHVPTANAHDALREGAPIVQPGWDTNLFVRDRIRSGDADAAAVVQGCSIANLGADLLRRGLERAWPMRGKTHQSLMDSSPSISSGISNGKPAMPTALRVCWPRSGP